MAGARRAAEDFEAYVAGRARELVRLAYAVCGDRRLAVDATVAALAGLRGSWASVTESGTPAVRTREVVLHRLLHRRAGGTANRRPEPFDDTAQSGPGDAFDDAAWDDDGPVADRAVLAAYAALVPDQRALLALGTVCELDPVTVAAVLGVHGGEVERLTLEALALVGAARDAALVAAGMRPGTRPVAEHVRTVVEAATDRALLPDDLTLPIAAVASRRRTRGRVAVGALVAVLTTGGVAVSRLATDRPPPASTATTAEVEAIPSGAVGVAAWPARGRLAKDPRVRTALTRALAAGSDVFGTAAARVLYADVVDGRAVAVAVGTQTSDLGEGGAVVMLSSPDADPLHLTTTAPGWFDGVDVLAFTAPTDRGHSVVVLAAPGSRTAEWSGTVAVSADGHVSRPRWTSLPLRDGAGGAAVGAVALEALALRVDGTPVGAIGLDDTGSYRLGSVPITDGRYDLTALDSALRRWTADRVAAITGLDPATLRTTVTVRGRADRGRLADELGGREARVVVLATTLPNGAAVRTAVAHEVRPGAGVGAGPRFLALEPFQVVAPKEIRARPFVYVDAASDGTAGQVAVVLAPGAATAALRPGPEAAAVTERLVDGSGLLRIGDGPVEDGATVTTTDAAGRTIGTWPWFGDPDPLARYAYG